jgi:hypothetical protein
MRDRENRIGVYHLALFADSVGRAGLSNRRVHDRVDLAIFTAAKTPYLIL